MILYGFPLQSVVNHDALEAQVGLLDCLFSALSIRLLVVLLLVLLLADDHVVYFTVEEDLSLFLGLSDERWLRDRFAIVV